MSFSATKDQAKCLDDVPAPVARYDFLRQGQRPGEQFKGGKISEYFFIFGSSSLIEDSSK